MVRNRNAQAAGARVVTRGAAALLAAIAPGLARAELEWNFQPPITPMAQQMCSKQDIQKTATGYVSDSVCSFSGMNTTSHAEITGDFNSAYTVKTSSHAQGGAAGAAGRDTTMTLEAKWLGACKADQKPGDIVMPGGMKMNVKDMNKLKNLIPGVKQ